MDDKGNLKEMAVHIAKLNDEFGSLDKSNKLINKDMILMKLDISLIKRDISWIKRAGTVVATAMIIGLGKIIFL